MRPPLPDREAVAETRRNGQVQIMNNNILPPPYRVIKPLGHGGIGEIYLAYHENLQKQVVVKKVKDHCKDVVDSRIEVDILKNLHHQFLPQVYDFLQVDEQIYTVIDYISGHDLEYYCKQNIRFSEEQLLIWLQQLLEVLEYLHTRKPMILHCDIKPANIMITEEGNICLIDFNISIDGESNKDLIGLSNQFASPEQVEKADRILAGRDDSKVVLDGRTDLYSAGAVFYFLMTGVYPNARRENFVELKYLNEVYSDALANIVSKAMHPDIHRRFKSAGEMLKALQHLEAWSTKQIQRRKMIVAAGMTAALAGILGIAGGIYHHGRVQYRKYVDTVETFVEKEDGWEYLSHAENETQDLYEEGVKILNEEQYQKYFEKDPISQAELLYATGNCALYLEQYEEAAQLLEDVVEIDGENADLYRDLALAYAGENDVEEAEWNLRMAKQLGATEADTALIQAEISHRNGEKEEAYEMAKSALQKASADMMAHAVSTFLLTAEACGHTEESIDYLIRHAADLSDSTRIYWLRRAAQEALNIGQTTIAGECLEQVIDSKIVLVEDLYNLDAVYEKEGSWDKSRKLLKQIQKEYPGEYKAYIRLAYVSYRYNNDRRPADRSYDEVFACYDRATKLMEEKGIRPESEPDMVQLEAIITQLKELGWEEKE